MDTKHVVTRLRELRIVPVLAVDAVDQGLKICAARTSRSLPEETTHEQGARE